MAAKREVVESNAPPIGLTPSIASRRGFLRIKKLGRKYVLGGGIPRFVRQGVIIMAYDSHLEPDTDSIIEMNYPLHPATDLADYVREYSRQRPEVVAIVCFGLGFILGWKLKPW
jgi:hypothetical protein